MAKNLHLLCSAPLCLPWYIFPFPSPPSFYKYLYIVYFKKILYIWNLSKIQCVHYIYCCPQANYCPIAYNRKVKGGEGKRNKRSKQEGGQGGAFISPSSANLYFIALSICLLLLQMILHARSTFRWFKSYFLFPFQQLLLVNSISTETTSNSNQFCSNRL